MERLQRICKRITEDFYLWRWALLVLLVYGCVTQIVFGTICPFVVFSGFPCPACGLTRGVCAILTGHWKMAAAYNITAFLWLAAGTHLVLLYALYCRKKQNLLGTGLYRDCDYHRYLLYISYEGMLSGKSSDVLSCEKCRDMAFTSVIYYKRCLLT